MVKENNPIPEDQELRRLAENLIQKQTTMALATAQGNVAWAAPIYYVYLRSCFYFFSEQDSRHIQDSLASDQASSAIFVDASTWQEIRGIQMSGTIEPVSAGLEALQGGEIEELVSADANNNLLGAVLGQVDAATAGALLEQAIE